MRPCASKAGATPKTPSNIYAITDPATGHKGLLIDAFDVFDELCHRDLSERLIAHRETAPAGDQDVPMKFGLRKIYKAEFERDPERYVLREGFPDVPPCPFGEHFSILGFDTRRAVLRLARYEHHARRPADQGPLPGRRRHPRRIAGSANPRGVLPRRSPAAEKPKS